MASPNYWEMNGPELLAELARGSTPPAARPLPNAPQVEDVRPIPTNTAFSMVPATGEVPAPYADATYPQRVATEVLNKQKGASERELEASLAGIDPNSFRSPFQLATMSNPYSEVRREEAARDPSLTPEERFRISQGGPVPEGKGIPAQIQGPPEATPEAKVTPTFADKSKAGGKPAGAGGAGAGGGGSASSSIKLSGTDYGPGGPDWNSPYWTEVAAADRLADAQARQQEVIGQVAGEKGELLTKQEADIRRQAAERDKILADHEAEIDRLAKDAASGRIDPDRWWHSQSTGRQIMLTLGAALSGFGAGLRGGGNDVLDMMQHAINNDIEAQKEDILNKHRGVEHQQGLLADLYKRFGRMDLAENAARQVGLELVDNKLAQLMAGPKSDEVKANALMLSGQIDERRQQHIFEQWSLAQKLAAAAAARRARAGGGGASAKQVQAFGAAVDRMKLGMRGEAIGNVERDLARGGAPGATGISGLAARWLPDLVLKNEWITNQSDLNALKAATAVGLSGRVSKSLADLSTKELGRGSEEGLRHGTQLERKRLEKDWNSLVARFGPDVAYAYLQNDPENLAELLGTNLQTGGGGAEGGGGGGGGGEDELVEGYGD